MPKYTKPKSKIVKKYKKSYKKSKRIVLVDVVNDPTIRKLNTGIQDKVYWFNKSITLGSYYYGTAGAVTAVLSFDPSGTSGSFAAISQWAYLETLFDHYYVKKIQIKFTYEFITTTGADAATDVYVRYNYNTNAAVPTTALMSNLPNVIHKRFTPQSPVFSYSFYPKMSRILYNAGGVLATESREVTKMRWCDVSFPVTLMGLVMVADILATGDQLTLDVEYEIGFRYSK